MKHESDISEVDFTAEDRGSYKPPVLDGDLSYDEVRERVLAALDADHRTLPQIKHHAGLEPRFDLSPVTDGMQIDKEIRKISNGTVSAFFHRDEAPKRFWLTGNGTVGVEFDDKTDQSPDEVPESVPAGIETKGPGIEITAEQVEQLASTLPSGDEIARKAGMPSKASFNRMLKANEDLKAAYDRGRRTFADRNQGRVPAKKRVEIDIEKLETLAGEFSTQAEICKAMGISSSLLGLRFADQEGVREAYDRGRERFFADNPRHSGQRRARTDPTNPIANGKRRDTAQPDIDLETVEELAARRLTQAEAAEELGVTVYVFKNRLNNGPLKQAYRDAWTRGQNRAKADGLTTRKVAERQDRKTEPAIAVPEVEPEQTSEIIWTDAIAESFIEDVQAAVDAGYTGPDDETGNETDDLPAHPEQCFPPFEGPIERHAQAEDPFMHKADEEPFPPEFYAEPNEMGFWLAELENDGQIEIKLSGNLFMLTERERMFVNVLIELSESFMRGEYVGPLVRSVKRMRTARERVADLLLGK